MTNRDRTLRSRRLESADDRHHHRPTSGLASLEWLLVIAAVGGFAAVMTVAIQQIIDNAAETRADPTVRLLQASVAAAELSDAATPVPGSDSLQPGAPRFAELRERCEEISDLYPDTVALSEWVSVTIDVDEPTPTTGAVVATTTTLVPDVTEVPDTTLPTDPTTPDTTPPQRTVWVCQVTSR